MSSGKCEPRLSDRSLGWLRYLYRKARTPDNWDKEGQPLPWWDDRTSPPTQSWCRFDLVDSSYALALMCDRTPAWREVYTAILDELVARHTSYWAALDWLTQIGHDPDRGNYPESYRFLIPAEHWGNYDVPGWTANGVEPWGLQMDPVGADGNLFFKGFFTLLLGLHRYVSGDDKWNQPFQMIRDGEDTFRWSYHEIVSHLAKQWAARPEGCHCENTKIWPLCLSGAGLGLMMHDALYGTTHHEVFDAWWENTATKRYMSLPADGRPEWLALYYDPLIDHVHQGGPFAAVLLSVYAGPQRHEEARRFYDWAADSFSWRNPSLSLPDFSDPKIHSMGAALATEFGDADAVGVLSEYAERHYEPTWFNGEFTWGLGLNEEHPRGQPNACLMMADAGSSDAWWRVFNRPNLKKFDEPTVVGVDFPTVAMRTARFDEASQSLSFSLESTAKDSGSTTFRIQNIERPDQCRIVCDGSEYPRWWTLPTKELLIESDMRGHDFIVSLESRA